MRTASYAPACSCVVQTFFNSKDIYIQDLIIFMNIDFADNHHNKHQVAEIFIYFYWSTTDMIKYT